MLTKEKAYNFVRNHALSIINPAIGLYRKSGMTGRPVLNSIAETGKSTDKLMQLLVNYSDAVCDEILHPESEFYKERLERAARNLDLRITKEMSGGKTALGERMYEVSKALDGVLGEGLDLSAGDYFSRLEKKLRDAFEGIMPNIDLEKSPISPDSISPKVDQAYIDTIMYLSRPAVMSEMNIQIIQLRQKQGKPMMIGWNQLEEDAKTGTSADPIMNETLRFCDTVITDGLNPSGSSTLAVAAARKKLSEVVEGQYKEAGLPYSEDILARVVDAVEQSARKLAVPPERPGKGTGRQY